jgi:hypothetical protein
VKPAFASSRELTLIPLAVLAVSLAFILSLPGPSAWAAYQSPVSPLSPILPLPTQPSIASQTAIVGGAPTPVPQPTGGGDSTAPLVAGGIVLVGLIVGVAVLLMRGQPPDESQEKE